VEKFVLRSLTVVNTDVQKYVMKIVVEIVKSWKFKLVIVVQKKKKDFVELENRITPVLLFACFLVVPFVKGNYKCFVLIVLTILIIDL
jgi:hypothetical protein